MSCIAEINRREAIPVRAIPYVEGWRQLSPDVVARGLSRTSEISELLCDLTAHHVSDGGIGDMLPKEWDNIVDALNALEIELNEKDSDHRKTRPEWLKRSIECLPAGCFVWRDELEASYNSQFGWRQSIHGGTISPICFARLDNAPERPGEHELNFNPRIPPEMVEVVFEGMPHKHLSDAPSEKPLNMTERTTLLCIVAALCKEAKIDLKTKGVAKRISIATDEIDASVSEETVRRVINKIHKVLQTRAK